MLQLTKCMLCKRYDVKDGKEVCEAFPEGIPEEKMYSDKDEMCSNGIKFQEDDNE